MSDAGPANPSDNGANDTNYSGTHDDTGAGDRGMPLWQRGLYMLGYGILAYFTFWVLIVMAIVQLIVVAIDGKPNTDLRRFSRNAVQYLWELLAFLVFASDERPFPFGPFPNIPD